MVDSCVFCNISKNRDKEEIIWEDEEFIAFLDRKPIKPGHTLIIPKKHVDFLFNLDDKTYHKLMAIAKKLYNPLIRAMGSKTVGIALSGFEVLHVHLHLVPRDKSGEFNILPKEASKEELHAVADKVRAEIQKAGI
jgi:histidine triad (HIT) family protein